jgi:hypothetical protein
MHKEICYVESSSLEEFMKFVLVLEFRWQPDEDDASFPGLDWIQMKTETDARLEEIDWRFLREKYVLIQRPPAKPWEPHTSCMTRYVRSA